MRLLFFLIVTTLLASPPVLAASGVKGRVAWRGQLVEGVTIRAYRAVADIPLERTVGLSAPTALDGTYQLELPPGEYVLTARSFDSQSRPGDYFCYYSGSPVTVYPERLTNVGFNLIRIPAEDPPKAAGFSGLEGVISFQDEPLERVYLYVYKDPAGGFKGPGYTVLPVEKGRFRLRLPPGDYWLLARKRAKGGQYGPIEIGDYFNYYYGNPVTIVSGEVRTIALETITRLSMLEADAEAPPFQGVRGQVLDGAGQPVSGVHVFAYRQPEMTGTPAFFSPATAADGAFELRLPETGHFYLLARQSFGGPAGEGEYYGKFEGQADHGLQISPEHPVHEVKIHVQPTAAH